MLFYTRTFSIFRSTNPLGDHRKIACRPFYAVVFSQSGSVERYFGSPLRLYANTYTSGT